MKISVFGDSYARTFDNYPDSDSMGKAWWEILAETYDLDNYGLAGSAAYYSIEQFDQHHSNYDKVIFFMTFPGRVYLQRDNGIETPGYPPCITNNFNSYASTASALELLQEISNYSKLDEKKMQSIMDYFLYVLNFDEEEFKIKLYMDYVKRTRPDALIISAHSMADIASMEMNHWGKKFDELMSQGYKEVRKCHLSTENNIIFADLINNWINSGIFTLDKDIFVKPKDSWEHYFKKYIL